MGKTSIEWTDRTWNPVRGCSRVSQGCVNCYAERQAARFAAAGKPFHGFVTQVNGHPVWTGKVELVENHLMDPLSWRTPSRVFVNSMSDLFHEALSFREIDRVIAVIMLAKTHTMQVLTKRAYRLPAYFCDPGRLSSVSHAAAEMGYGKESMAFEWPPKNLWLGVSVEDRGNKNRIDLLRKTPASVRFLSIEPLLEDIGELDLRDISWVIVGGESGPGARPFDVSWARSVIQQCKAAGVSCFVKQLGRWPTQDGAEFTFPFRDKKGGDMAEWPEDLRVREFPV